MTAITVSYGQVKGRAKQYPYYQPAIYEPRSRKDGVVTWRYVKHVGTPRRYVTLAERDARERVCEDTVFVPGIRHGHLYTTP